MVFNGEVEIDESYFGGVRKEKHGSGAAGKIAVFGMLKRHDKVYTVVVQNTKTKALMNIIARKTKPDSIIYSDAYHSYDALDMSEFHHHRIHRSDDFVDEKNHINGIDKKNFPLFLKECEFRFNHGTPKKQMRILRHWCDI